MSSHSSQQRKRILIHDYSGHAFPIQLSRQLAANGHDVLHLYSSSFQSPHGKLASQTDDAQSLTIRGIDLGVPFAKYQFVKRRFQEIDYGKLLAKEIEAYQPDVVLSGNTPLDVQKFALETSHKLGATFFFWLQDVQGIAIKRILQQKMSIVGSLIGQFYTNLEKNLLKKSDKVILISEDFSEIMDEWSVPKEKLVVIENWAPIEDIPTVAKTNKWSQKHNLENKFTFLYSGTMGLKHNPDLLLQVALNYKDRDDVQIIVVSEGLGADWLDEHTAKHNLTNLQTMGFQDVADLPSVLASSDVLIAILEPDAGIFSVPSKVLSYMCAKRAILLAVPEENLAARLVSKHGMGLVVPPTDTKGFVEAADRLLQEKDNLESYGERARAYAEETFNIQTITKRFEALFPA